MRTTAIINLKGGVGKTTTALNMAAILAQEHDVLLIDADPQANLTEFFGFTDPEKLCEHTLAELLDVYGEGRSDLAEDYVYETPMPGISLVPASIDLINADIASIRSDTGAAAVRAINNLLHALQEGEKEGGMIYDHVIIDCPPSFTAASVAAIYAADDIVIPLEPSYFAITGLTKLLAQINSVRRIQPRVRVAGALITMWRNSPACIQGECALRASSIPVFRQVIRRSDKVAEATFQRESLQAYSPQSAAGRDYRAWVAEYLEEVR